MTANIPEKDEDSFLIERLKTGDEKSFEILYHKYWKKLFAIAYYHLQSKDLAKDLLQEVFVSLWSRRGTPDIKNLEHYLASSLKYQILTHFKTDARHSEHHRNIARYQLTASDNTTVRQLEFEELYLKMEEEVNKLPHKCQAVFRLSRYEECTLKEIAQKMNISPKTVEHHITRALRLLRHGLKEFLPIAFLIFFF